MLSRVFLCLFWAVLFVCFAMAIAPSAPDPMGNDKLQHALAFAVLTMLALLAYPQAKPPALFAAMAAFGGFIEIAQGLSFIGRDADVMDWIVDMIAAAAALAGSGLVRGWLRSASIRT